MITFTIDLMNVRKSVDYSVMFAALDTLIAAELTQMKLYFEIGRVVSNRPEADQLGLLYYQAPCGRC